MTHDLMEATIRVASVPSSHVYVCDLAADGSDDEDGLRPDSLVRAIWSMWADPVPAISVQGRVEQRQAIARAHRRLYEDVLAR